jgi:hypothetical protein
VKNRQARSYSIITDPAYGMPQESDTFTCKHCCRVVFVKPRCDAASLGGRCYVCDGLICPACVGKGCDPMEKKLERWEAAGRLYRDMRA